MNVVHINHDKYDVYIGRGSKWGNPFRIGIDGSRKEVISKYRTWILKQKDLLSEMIILDGKILGCHCKPKPCHGDVIMELICGMKNEKILKWEDYYEITLCFSK